MSLLQPSNIKTALCNLIDHASSHLDSYVKCPGKDLSRSRKCDFKTTVGIILNFQNHSLNGELKSYFDYNNKKDRPSKSSFVKQRAKINDQFFPWLFHSFNEKVPATGESMGYRLLAGDGSDTNLPPLKEDSENFVAYASKNGGYYQMHMNTLYNILDNRFEDIVIQPRPKSNEAAALCDMVDRYQSDKPTIFTADRGYQSLNLMAHIFEKGHFFLIRARDLRSETSSLKHVPLPDSGEFDQTVALKLTRSRKKKYTKHPDQYKILHTKRRFDFIDEGDTQSIYTLEFRIVCVDLGDGSFEYLLTNLPREKFPPQELKKIYHLRWNLETSYRYLKYPLSLTWFHSKKREFIVQEIYAKLIMYNLTSKILAIAEERLEKLKPSPKRKWEQKLSFEDAIREIRSYLRRRMSNEKIIALLLSYKSPIRPGRKCTRKVRSQTARSLNNRA